MKAFDLSISDPGLYFIGDEIHFISPDGLYRIRVVSMKGNTMTVELFPTERQETLGRLLGRPAEDFIP